MNKVQKNSIIFVKNAVIILVNLHSRVVSMTRISGVAKKCSRNLSFRSILSPHSITGGAIPKRKSKDVKKRLLDK